MRKFFGHVSEARRVESKLPVPGRDVGEEKMACRVDIDGSARLLTRLEHQEDASERRLQRAGQIHDGAGDTTQWLLGDARHVIGAGGDEPATRCRGA